MTRSDSTSLGSPSALHCRNVLKGRNRDTTWFAIIDRDWNDGLKDAYLRWLDPTNFDADGVQKRRLSELTAPFVHLKS